MMDPPHSCSSSITMNDVSEEIEELEIAESNPPKSPNVSQDQFPTPAVARDNLFYFETVVFQVEDTLFRVFKSGFEVQGTPFEAIFSLPQAPRKIVEGIDDSRPIYLHGINKVKFRSFLRVLYPFKGVATTYAEWIAALDLAIMWDFKEIRKTCIEALSELIKSRTVFDNILLAKKYKVEKWLRDGYIQLLQKKEALEFGDDIRTSEIDVTTIARLLYIRERKHCQSGTIFSKKADNYLSTDEANRRIDEVFADEIAGMQDD